MDAQCTPYPTINLNLLDRNAHGATLFYVGYITLRLRSHISMNKYEQMLICLPSPHSHKISVAPIDEQQDSVNCHNFPQ